MNTGLNYPNEFQREYGASLRIDDNGIYNKEILRDFLGGLVGGSFSGTAMKIDILELDINYNHSYYIKESFDNVKEFEDWRVYRYEGRVGPVDEDKLYEYKQLLGKIIEGVVNFKCNIFVNSNFNEELPYNGYYNKY